MKELEWRVRELEGALYQNEYEHKLLRKEMEELKKKTLPLETRNKLEELISILDQIAERKVTIKEI